MAKTLKDCMLEGGIKGKIFRYYEIDEPYTDYQIKDIRYDEDSKRVMLDVSAEQKGMVRGHESFNLGNCLNDTLVEEEK